MPSLSEVRERIAVVVPVHFQAAVHEETIGEILVSTLSDQSWFCAPEHLLIVVERGSAAERILRQAESGSPLFGLHLHVLERNLGKAGAVRAGLETLLEKTDARYLITRDCDGDHRVEDLPRLLHLAEQIYEETRCELISIFGVRASLAKPMGWLREEWEKLTNRTLIDLADYLRARVGEVVDKRYWNGYELDAQSGYRLYSRKSARLAVEGLSMLPEDRPTFTFACELVPFLDVVSAGGIIGQIQRLARVEQPVSSFRGVPLAEYYGALFAYLSRRYQIAPHVLVQLFDNHLLESSLYFSEFRDQLLECRRHIAPEAPRLHAPNWV